MIGLRAAVSGCGHKQAVALGARVACSGAIHWGNGQETTLTRRFGLAVGLGGRMLAMGLRLGGRTHIEIEGQWCQAATIGVFGRALVEYLVGRMARVTREQLELPVTTMQPF